MLHFNIRFIKTGQKYGLDDCLVNDKATMIEFYDPRFPHTPMGQFVSRYYVETFMDTTDGLHGGLRLDGGIPEWTLSEEQMREVCNTISDMQKRGAL